MKITVKVSDTANYEKAKTVELDVSDEVASVYVSFADAERKNNRNTKDHRAGDVYYTSGDDDGELINPVDLLVSQSNDYADFEIAADVRKAIDTLQPQQKDLLMKVFFEDMTCAEIAAEEGVSKAAIHNRLDRIYAQLRKKLENYFD